MYSDVEGDGGIQTFRWDLEHKRVHVKTERYDGEELTTEETGD